MGKPSQPKKALLFCSTLYSQETVLTEALKRLTAAFGEVLFYSPSILWDFSDYYNKELGEVIFRRYIFFKDLIHQDALADIKLLSNQIEDDLSVDQKRTINLDTGYLTPAKIVLASTKDFSHRIYLGKGIYAEVTLIYKKGEFVHHLNTYPDYKHMRHQFYFHIARRILVENIYF
ncbi:MAG: DUF4416 family protein [Thermodesulfovibrionales bacterium]